MFAAHCTSLPPSLLKAAAELCQQQQQQPIATLLETAYTNLIKGAASSPPTGFETLLGHFIEGPWVALLEAEGRTTFEEGEWETLKKGIASDLKVRGNTLRLSVECDHQGKLQHHPNPNRRCTLPCPPRPSPPSPTTC